MLDHVFSDGEFAMRLWKYFGWVARISYLGIGVRSKLAAWWFGCRSNRYIDVVNQILPILICWQIWKARNRKVLKDGSLPRCGCLDCSGTKRYV